jgi:hypothetical protein
MAPRKELNGFGLESGLRPGCRRPILRGRLNAGDRTRQRNSPRQ